MTNDEKKVTLKRKTEFVEDKKLCPLINDCCKEDGCMLWVTYPAIAAKVKPLAICAVVDMAMNTGRR